MATIEELMKLLAKAKKGDGIKLTVGSEEVELTLDAPTEKILKSASSAGDAAIKATVAAPAPDKLIFAVYDYKNNREGSLLDDDPTKNMSAMLQIANIIKPIFNTNDTLMQENMKPYHDSLQKHKFKSLENLDDFTKKVKGQYDAYLNLIKKGAPKTPGEQVTFVTEIIKIFTSVIPYFTRPYSSSSSSGRAAATPVTTSEPDGQVKSIFGNIGAGGAMLFGGDSSLKRLIELDSELGNLSAIMPFWLTSAEQKRIDSMIAQLRKEKQKILDSKEYLSTRFYSAASTKKDMYKINEEEYIINTAIEAIKNNNIPYIVDHPAGGPITINDFKSLRKYILDYSNDPITLLLKLTDLNPISLDDFLPKIEDDKLTISRNEKGILVVNINDDEVEMPNPLGNKNNRQEFSKKYKANHCYGLGGDKSDTFCVSILNKCLASDEKSLEDCRHLFTSPEWEKIKAEGIKNSNIYLIKEFLLKIGYPRINDRFDTNIDTWFDIVKSRYSANDTVLGKIKTNDKLKEVIVDMVEKYNRINDLEKKSRSTSSRNFHLPMKGGDNMSIINSNLYELYGGLNQNVVNLPSLSPSQKIYNIFKELVKDQDITSKYRNFFDKMEKNIENQNHNIDSSVRNNFNTILTSFKQSEEKLNKLLQTMHNFAWFLGQTVNTANLSDADKKINEEASNRLNKVLNQENINAYNAAREKLVNSLNKKSQKLISIAAGHPFILIASS